MSPHSALLLFLAVFLFASAVSGAPSWFDALFPNYQDQATSGSRQSRSEAWKAPCRIINPDPYVNVGKVPYPAVPFCPY